MGAGQQRSKITYIMPTQVLGSEVGGGLGEVRPLGKEMSSEGSTSPFWKGVGRRGLRRGWDNRPQTQTYEWSYTSVTTSDHLRRRNDRGS